jgi:RNA polymerase sigma-70 factor (ECF subfamily)
MAERSPNPEIEARFEVIIEKYGKFLRQTIARLCPKDMGLQFSDIEQDARLRLWRALQSERGITQWGSYIYRIAVTVTINAIHRMKTRREEQWLSESEEQVASEEGNALISDPEKLAEQEELRQKIEASIGLLSENRRLAVRLYLQGMTTQETADCLDWSEAKARNLTYRGLKDLRKQLRAAGIEYE